MPHANGKIYIDTSTTPHKGVSIADIQAVLRTAAYDSINGLVTSGNINKWAKFKPVRLPVLGTDEQLEEDTAYYRMVWKQSADWWKGEQKSIYGSVGRSNGFGFVVYESLAELKASESGLGWTYERPRGENGGGQGVHEWYRFKDFVQYNHGATSPFDKVGLEDDSYPIGLECRIYLYVSFDRFDEDMLGLSDFPMFDDWYFGVAVYGGGNNGLVGVGTSTEKLSTKSDNSRCVVMTLPARAKGSCTLYPFFSVNTIAWSDSASEPSGTRRYVPIPSGPETIKVTEGGPLEGLTFTLASGSTISFNPNTARFIATFARLAVANTGIQGKTLYKSELYLKIHIETDPATYHESEMITMSLTGTVNVADGASDVELIPADTSKVVTDTGVIGWLQANNVTYEQCRKFAYLYYRYETTVDDYHLIATFDVAPTI